MMDTNSNPKPVTAPPLPPSPRPAKAGHLLHGMCSSRADAQSVSRAFPVDAEDTELSAMKLSLKLAEWDASCYLQERDMWREHAERWERVAVGALCFTATWMALSAYLAWELYSK